MDESEQKNFKAMKNIPCNLKSAEDQWRASLKLGFLYAEGKTILKDRQFEGPLRVQRPFYPQSQKICHTYIIHPPGGIVGGDQLLLDIQLSPNSWGLVTTPGATKYYRSKAKTAIQRTRLRVQKEAVLEWLPQENILFNGTFCNTLVRVDVEKGASFIGWDITCLGRPASGQTLQQCKIRNYLELWRGSKPQYLDRTRYTTDHPVMDATWGLRSHPVTATMLCSKSDASLVNKVRESITKSSDSLFAVSNVNGILVQRYLGNSVEEAKSLFRIAWQVLRMELFGIRAIQPRIWNT